MSIKLSPELRACRNVARRRASSRWASYPQTALLPQAQVPKPMPFNEAMLLPAMIATSPSRCVMTASPAQEPARSTDQAVEESTADTQRILCNHCRRTASNGIRCLGMCVADSDY